MTDITVEPTLSTSFTEDASNDLPGSAYQDLPNTDAIMGVGLMTLMIVLGVFGNLLLIVSIILSPQLRKVPNAFILHLALIHLIYVLCHETITLAVYIKGRWQFSLTLILIYHSIGMCLHLLNVASIIIVAYVRYFRLLKPDLYKSIIKAPSLSLLMGVLYILSISITAIFMQITKDERLNQETKVPPFSPKYMMSVNAQKDTFLLPIVLCAGAAVFLMLYVYANVHLVVHNTVRVSVPNFETDHRDMVLHQRKDLLKKELVYIKAVMVVFVFYILTLLQNHIVYEIDRKQSVAPVKVCVISVIISRAPFCLSWLILGAVSTSFRQAYFSIFLLRCLRLPSRIFPHVANNSNQPNNGTYPDINVMPPSVSQGLDSHAEIIEYLAALTVIKHKHTRNLSPQIITQGPSPGSRASSRTLELSYLDDLERVSSGKGIKVTCDQCQMPFTITAVTPQPSTSSNINSFSECETCRGVVDTSGIKCQTGNQIEESVDQGAPYPYTAWNSEDVSYESIV